MRCAGQRRPNFDWRFDGEEACDRDNYSPQEASQEHNEVFHGIDGREEICAYAHYFFWKTLVAKEVREDPWPAED